MRQWITERRRFFPRACVALWLCVVVLALIYVFLRLRTIELLHMHFATVHTEQTNELNLLKANLEDIQYRLDELDRAVFGEVMPKINRTAKPSRVEVWQQNRDKAFREFIRISNLKQLEHEARIRRLEQEIR